MFATGLTMGLAKWIIDDTCLVLVYSGTLITYSAFVSYFCRPRKSNTWLVDIYRNITTYRLAIWHFCYCNSWKVSQSRPGPYNFTEYPIFSRTFYLHVDIHTYESWIKSRNPISPYTHVVVTYMNTNSNSTFLFSLLLLL